MNLTFLASVLTLLITLTSGLPTSTRGGRGGGGGGRHGEASLRPSLVEDEDYDDFAEVPITFVRHAYNLPKSFSNQKIYDLIEAQAPKSKRYRKYDLVKRLLRNLI